jgi:polysaccharide pyruvyl transferase WcaK-like protein
LRADVLASTIPVWLESWLALAQSRKVHVRWVVLGNGGDAELARAQQARYVGSSDVVDVSNLPLREAVKALHSLECLVSMRYHGLVLGALAGVAVCGRGHDPKLEQLMAELGAPEVEALGTAAQWEAVLAGLSPKAQAARVAELQARALSAMADLKAILKSS